jgi:hypothetical protein
MNKKELIGLSEWLKTDLILSLKKFVMEHGTDCTDYERNKFGLDVEEQNGLRVTKVLNFYDKCGCYFFEPDMVNDDSLQDAGDKNLREALYEHVVYTAYQCLYIVVDVGGNDSLHYYRFTNGGVKWDDDQAEPDHGDCSTITLLDLHYLLQTINVNF